MAVFGELEQSLFLCIDLTVGAIRFWYKSIVSYDLLSRQLPTTAELVRSEVDHYWLIESFMSGWCFHRSGYLTRAPRSGNVWHLYV